MLIRRWYVATFAIASACAAPASSGPSSSEPTQPGSSDPADAGPQFDPGVDATADAGAKAAPAGVFANTLTELYRFDPPTQTLTFVATFSGCADVPGGVGVMDIAIDSQGNAYATDYGHELSRLDLTTGACTLVKSNQGLNANGIMPNTSLSFVPQGVLDPNSETLVGFLDAQWIGDQFLETYATWSTTSGAFTSLAQNGDFEQITDVVTVKNTSFAIARHSESTSFPSCAGAGQECVLEIDSATGVGIHAYGSTVDGIEGLAFWAGTLYGFDSVGNVWSIAWQNGQLVTTQIPVNLTGLSFRGAASSPAAPPTDADGGGIPIN